MRISFVLLHYNNIEDTISLVEQIQKINLRTEDIVDIVIVDNASPNNSGNLLKRKYFNEKNVHLFKLKKNMGFSKGNNIGFKFAVENLNPDFIVLSNTDINLLNANMLEIIESIYKEKKFAVLGPNIVKPIDEDSYVHQNPYFFNKKITKIFVIREIIRINMNEIKNHFKFLIKNNILKGRDYFKPRRLDKPIKNNNFNNLYISTDVTLSGAFMVFSKDYFQKFPDGLDPKTFMYGEEHFLSYRCQKNNLLILYSSKFSVEHFEGKSTLSEKTEIQRSKFLRIEATKSLIKLFYEIKNDDLKNKKWM